MAIRQNLGVWSYLIFLNSLNFKNVNQVLPALYIRISEGGFYHAANYLKARAGRGERGINGGSATKIALT